MKRYCWRRARPIVLWAIGAFLGLQLAFVLAIDLAFPESYDLEYRARIDLLKNRVRECPERPVLIALGSSHMGVGFNPSQLPELRTASGDIVLPFNFAHLAAGPRSELVQLNRVLRAGIKPRFVVIEFDPCVMNHEAISVQYAGPRDLPLLLRHDNFWKVSGIFMRNRTNPFFNRRLCVVEELAPPFATRYSPRDRVSLLDLGDDDHWSRLDSVTAEQQQRYLRICINDAEPLRHLTFDPNLESALRDCVDSCRQERIDVLMLTPPQHSEMRALYSAESRRTVRNLVERMHREFGVDTIDASDWIDDAQFYDGEHLLPDGAAAFTARLGRDVLTPFVAGETRNQTPDRDRRTAQR